MVNVYRRPFWLYPMFQIPLILLGMCLLMALLFWLLGFGRPQVAVAIAIDLSSSTYETQFNAPGTIMDKEVQAVKAYVDKNVAILKKPNQVQIFGFADGVRPLTRSFQTDNEKIKQELDQALQPNLVDIIGGGTNIDVAITEGTDALSSISKRCRELLIVSDGEVSINPRVITEAQENKIKINAVVIEGESQELQQATRETRGIYLTGEARDLNYLFTEKLFESLNNNWPWVLLWLGLAWISLMWTLTMPLDRWIFQRLLKMRMDLAGRLALGNAFFWSAITPIILWQVYQLLDLVAPFFRQC